MFGSCFIAIKFSETTSVADHTPCQRVALLLPWWIHPSDIRWDKAPSTSSVKIRKNNPILKFSHSIPLVLKNIQNKSLTRKVPIYLFFERVPISIWGKTCLAYNVLNFGETGTGRKPCPRAFDRCRFDLNPSNIKKVMGKRSWDIFEI